MQTELISIVIPAYNLEKYLREAIESVLAQTYKNYEIIVVDDGSTDRTASIAKGYAEQIKLIQQENKGLGGARNAGILAAKADLVGLLDADDEWKPDYLERMISLIHKQPDAAVYYSSAQAMDESGNDLPQIFGGELPSNKIYRVLLRSNFIIPSTVIFRRCVILEAGLFEEKNRDLHGCEDWDLWLRLSPEHKFVGMSEPLVRYRLHANTFSANPQHMQKAVRSVVEKNFGLEDDKYADWSSEKKRAFGGVYRYQTITFIQRQKNWDAAGGALQKALMIDPSLAVNLSFFYELALGNQQSGYRGSSLAEELDANALSLERIVHLAVHALADQSTRKQALGTTYLALGLASYNSGIRSKFRKYYGKALVHRPELLLNHNFIGIYFRSFFSKEEINRFKGFLGR
jgi:glycosyltransferase involved in cell wall biosynthesis